MRVSAVGAFAVLLTLAAGASAQPSYTIFDLGPMPGGQSSYATDMNCHGEVSGWAVDADGKTWPVTWDVNQDLHNLGTMGSSNKYHNSAAEINSSGHVVGRYRDDADVNHAFFYDGAAMSSIAGDGSVAYGINDSDSVAGFLTTASGDHHPFVYSGGTANDLDTPTGYQHAYAFGINDAGQTVGYASINQYGYDTECVAWVHDGVSFTVLPSLGGNQSAGGAIDPTGHVVGWSETEAGQIRAVLWSDGTAHPLADLTGYDYNTASDINIQGDIVGAVSSSSILMSGRADSTCRAVLYDDGVVYDLNSLVNDPGWSQLLRATGINDSGWVAGWGLTATGETHAFLLVPEPATLALLALGGLALIRRRRYNQHRC